LAQILTRQGKKDKAIEVYKKLIWKFPQKKAYFAAQIEDLKK
jgi:TolA-binding protein